MLISQEKYSLKCPYKMNPTRIVVHNTANDASARNEVKYMQNNKNQTLFYFAVLTQLFEV
jgi:N-acetylmuramoyl-L-alanine amidase CwlA